MSISDLEMAIKYEELEDHAKGIHGFRPCRAVYSGPHNTSVTRWFVGWVAVVPAGLVKVGSHPPGLNTPLVLCTLIPGNMEYYALPHHLPKEPNDSH